MPYSSPTRRDFDSVGGNYPYPSAMTIHNSLDLGQNYQLKETLFKVYKLKDFSLKGFQFELKISKEETINIRLKKGNIKRQLPPSRLHLLLISRLCYYYY